MWALLALLVVPAAAQASPWSAPAGYYDFTQSPSAGAPQPRVAVLPSGDAVVVHHQQTGPSTAQLVARRRPAGSVAFGPVKVIGARSDWESFEVRTDDAGRVTVVWDDPTTNQVKASVLATPAGDWSEPVTAYAPPVGEVVVDMAINAFEVAPDGRAALGLRAAYDTPGGTRYAARVVTRDGGVWSPASTLAIAAQMSAVEVALNETGGAIATWGIRSGSPGFYSHTVRASVRPAGGAWAAEELASAPNNVHEFDPVAAIDAAGRATLVWGRLGTDETRPLAAARRAADGTWTQDGEIVIPGNRKYAVRPSLGVDAEGDVTLAYQFDDHGIEYQWDTYSSRVEVLERTATGEWGAAKVVSTGKKNTPPSDLTVAPGGAAAMVWQSSGTDTRIVVGHRLADGTWSTPEIVAAVAAPMVINSTPALGFRPGVETLVAWSRRAESDYTKVWGEASWGMVSAPDTTPPDTSVTAGPAGAQAGSTAAFSFDAPGETGASFECRLDRGEHAGSWTACSSPVSFAGLGPAPYTFRVRATDSATNQDATPATRAFRLTPLGGQPGAQAGAIDGSFGHAGHVHDWAADEASGLLAVDGGRFVAASSAGLTRYTADGSLDTTFGDGGDAAPGLGTVEHGTRGFVDVTRAPGGKLVAITSWWDGSAWQLGVARFTADGRLDPSFSDDGMLSASPNDALQPRSVHVQSDGKVVVVISAHDTLPPAGRRLMIVRYTAGGALDETLGGTGVVWDLPLGQHCFPRDSLLEPDDRLVITGRCDSADGVEGDFVTRYDTNGTRDETFGGGDGLTLLEKVYHPEAIARQTDGKLVVAGRQTPDALQDDLGVERLATDGTLDTAFGSAGMATMAPSGSTDLPADMLVQDDGRIVVYGSGPFGASSWVTRQNADGSADLSFGDAGVARQTPDAFRVYPREIVRQADGRYLLAGGVLRHPNTADDRRMTFTRLQDRTPPDAVAPETTLDGGPAEGATLTVASATFSFHSDEEPQAFDCKLDRAGQAATEWAACASPKAYAGLTNGTYTFSVRSRDAAGNLDPTPILRTFTVDVPVPPANDAFASAIALPGDAADGAASTLGATRESGEPQHAGSAGSGSVWWTWEATAVRDVVVDTCGASFDTVLAVYTGGALGALVPVVANDDADGACGGGGSRVQFRSAAGQTYRIAVDGYDGARGAIALRLRTSVPDLTPPAVTIASGPTQTTRATRAEFTFASEPGATFLCSLDGATPSACQPVYDVGAGHHAFAVWARDAAGNQSQPAIREWTVDPASATDRHELAAGAATPAAPAGGGVQVTSPVAGTVALTASVPGAAPSGYAFFGDQFEISAPAASAAAPLRLVFRVDAARLPAGAGEASAIVFRDGAPVALCAASDGTATPAPCVAQRRRLGDGDLEVTVLSDHASAWNLGQAVTPAAPGDVPPVTGGDVPQPGQSPPPPGDGAPEPAPRPPLAPAIAISFPKGVKLLPSLKNGFVVGGTTSAAARIEATVSLSAKTARKLKLGRGPVKVAAAKGQFGAGGFSLEFKPAKRLRKKLGRAKVLPLVLEGRAVGATGLTTTFRKTISLRR